MAKVFNSIEKELINYIYIKENQICKTSSFSLTDSFLLNKNLMIMLKLEHGDNNQLNEHWVSIYSTVFFQYPGDHLHSAFSYDVLIIKVLSNKIHSVYLCDYHFYNNIDDFSSIILRSKKQDLSDLMDYIRIQLRLDYSEIQNFEKKLKLYNISII